MLLKRKFVITFLICLEFLITILYTSRLGQNSEIIHVQAQITTAADDKFGDMFPNFRK